MIDKTRTALHLSYRADIDGLRAIAVMSVVGFHAFPECIQGGYIGVDIFFVISGYLISSIIFSNLENDRFSIAIFYQRRVQRIFPALITVMIVSLAFGSYGVIPNAFAQLGKHVAASAAFVENFTLYSESGYFDNASETKPMLHMWSLAIEEQFYIFWPLMLAFVWKRQWSFLRLTAVIGLLSFAVNILLIRRNATAAFYWPVARFWELMIGGVLAYINLHRQQTLDSWKNLRSVIGFGMLAVGFALITSKVPYPGYWALLPTLGAFMIISAGPDAVLNRQLLASRFMVGVGLISYPLYLWHWPLLAFAQTIRGSGVRLRIILVIAAIVLAWITYEYIEKPIRSKPRAVLPLLAVMAVVACCGYTSFWFKGFGSRVSDAKIGITNITEIGNVYDHFEYKKLVREGVCHSVAFVKAISNGCIEIRQKNIFVLGDSYAASLYSGLSRIRDEKHQNFGITQLTDGNGPPFFMDGRTDDGKSLEEANTNRLLLVQKYQPDVILITWMVGAIPKNESLQYLVDTIHRIHGISPRSKIIVVGPFPTWRGSLMQQLFGYYVLYRTSPPVYMSYGLDNSIKDWDNFLKAAVPKSGVIYFSSYDCFCVAAGCLTRTGDDVDDIVAVDWGHLTAPGAYYLVTRMQHAIFD